ncbi:MAG: hypothetical protein WAT66_06935 [Actinomycetota bacterium]
MPTFIRSRPRRSTRWLACAVLLLLVATLTGTSASTPSTENGRRETPEDRYAMAGGCYTVRAANGRYVIRDGQGFIASAPDPVGAEPFHFQATDLGRYLLFGKQADFLAVSAGADETVLKNVTDQPQVATVGGVAYGMTDTLPYAPGKGNILGAVLGRGQAIVAAPKAGDRADWIVDQDPQKGAFSFRLPATNQIIAIGDDGRLVPKDASELGADGLFTFQLTSGCARFPEIEINATGPIVKGATPFSKVRGFFDAHAHMMAFEFIGGRSRCGRPWHPYGVEKALVDCPDHKPGGHGAVLEAVLSGGDPIKGHNTDGWPTFAGWPVYNSYTHEQVYYRWLERAWRGGLRLMTNLLVDNHSLCTIYPYKTHSCNEMVGVRLQAQRLHELERYIDAQNGGPGEGWFRIVTDPFQARRVINAGKLAVIMGIEVSIPFNCGLILDVPQCDTAQIDRQLDEVYALGVRQMELANKLDNALTGVTGDGGATGQFTNFGNRMETGRYWQLETCTEEDGHTHDKTQTNIHDDAGTPEPLTGRDSIFAGVLKVAGRSGVAPIYPPSPHCNIRGLSELGAYAVRGLISRGMIFDPDHMSARARVQALDILEKEGYSGVLSSHSWADDTIYEHVYELGGLVAPAGDGSAGFVEDWRQRRKWADPRFLFSLGFGSDVNGFSALPGPRQNAKQKVSYPFTGFGGVIFDKQRSGERVYDINVDGVPHFGLYPDWLEDLRLQAGDAIIEDMLNAAEAYLQMWERASGIAPNACRADVADLSEDDLSAATPGMTPEAVLRAVGQPSTRTASTFEFCMTGGRTGKATFSENGRLESVAVT